jgi:hypothetical protein
MGGGDSGLPERDSAVIRRYFAMPQNGESGGLQNTNDFGKQKPVLKDAAGEGDGR